MTSVNLDEWPVGRDALIRNVEGPPRLAELGVRPGGAIRVVQAAAHGAKVVALGADRFALDGATCRGIEVAAAGQVTP